MSDRLASLRLGVAVAALALGSPWLCTVQAGSKQRGKAIEFSNPRSDDGTTNLQQLTVKKDSVRQYEDELARSARPFSGESSLDAVAPPLGPLPMPIIPSKRLKEQLDRRKNLFLLGPDDLVHTPSMEEMLNVPEYGPDGREKQSKSPVEQYYDRQDAKRTAAQKSKRSPGDDRTSDRGDDPRRHDGSKEGDDGALPLGLQEREQALRKLFQADIGGNPFAPAAAKSSSFSDIFGQGDITPTKEQELKQKEYIKEWSTIFDTSRPSPVGADVLKPSSDVPAMSTGLANPLGLRDSLPTGNEALGLVNPLFTPLGPQGVNFQTLGQSPLMPNADVPKAPMVPTFTFPRRPF